MKGIKIGIKEGIIIFITLIIMTNFIGFVYAGIIMLSLLAVNTFLRLGDAKTENKTIINSPIEHKEVFAEKTTGKIKNFFVSFFLAIFLSMAFLSICIPFLINTNALSYLENASIGQINLWRISIIFGMLTIITSAIYIIKHKKRKLVILFLWAFWILGTSLILIISYNTWGIKLNADIITKKFPLIGVAGIMPTLPFFIWFFGIYYCRKVAMRLGINTSVALLSGIFLPVLSLLIYLFYSYWKKTRELKIRILKITAGVVIILLLISAGIIYYIVGMPEYSLYKLKQAITNNNDVEFNKYFDIESVADNFEELPSQSKEWIDSLNTSILEIKEENPDKSKDASAYIPTGLTGKYLKNASISYSDQGSNNPNVALHFNDEGSKLFSEITKRNINMKLAIFLSGNLASSPIVQSEINNGEAIISGIDASQVSLITNAINEEKISTINGFKIKEKAIDGDYAKITIGKMSNNNGFELSMTRMEGRYWKINKIDTVIINNGEEKLPNPEGEKIATFNWKYKGKNYSLDEKLYDSYYKFYNSLPAQDVFNGESLVGRLEKDNGLFINESEGDKTISELAQSIKLLGEKNNLSENQLVELVSAFVQTIPYDTDKFNKIKAGNMEKVYYPYEVLYNNKGVCSDKSYLAYSLLRDLGYGVSLFLFSDPADSHMAMGIKCPIEYSNYDSGYCFLETTSLGNKIGSTPSLSKEFGTATSKVELSDFSNDSTESNYNPLGRIEILNKTDGLIYTGVIDTFNTQKEIDNLLATVRRLDRELNASNAELDNKRADLDGMEKNLKKMEKSGSYSGYENYYSKYSKAFSEFKKDIKAYNAKIATRNQINTKCNNLINSFYQ